MMVYIVKNKVILAVFILLVSTLLFQVAFCKNKIGVNDLNTFNSYEEYITHIAKGEDRDYKIIYKSYLGNSSEGSLGMLWYLENKLEKMEVYHFGSMGQGKIIYDFYDNHIIIDTTTIYYGEDMAIDDIQYYARINYILKNGQLYEININTQAETLCSEDEKAEVIQSLIAYGENLDIKIYLT